jgi:hypothetical protein
VTGRPSWLKIAPPITTNDVGYNGFQLIVEAAARCGLIPTHETAVVQHVDGEDGRKSPPDALFGHRSLPDARRDRKSMR